MRLAAMVAGLAMLGLAGCGVDGEPVPPPEVGVTIGGEVAVGMVLR